MTIRQRIGIGLAALLALVMLALFVGGYTSLRLSQTTLALQRDVVPILAEAGSVARIGNSMDAAVRALITARSAFEVDAARYRLRLLGEQLTTRLDALSSRLQLADSVAGLRRSADELNRLIAEIDPLVSQATRERLARDRAIAELQLHIDAWQRQLQGPFAHVRADDRRASERISELFAVHLAGDDPLQVRRVHQQLVAQLAGWRARAADGVPLAIGLLEALERHGLSQAIDDAQALEGLRLRFRIGRLQDRTLPLLAAVETHADAIADALRQEVEQQVERGRATVASILWLLAALGGGSVVAAFAIIRDLRRNVIARLERLQHWMRAEVEGSGAEQSVAFVDAGGSDEIADMSRAVEHFSRELGQREMLALAAHDRLLATHKQLLEAQQNLVVREKMAALGTLTAGVAHEINNPTNFADGAVQNLVVELQALHRFLLQLAGDDAAPEVRAAFEQRFARLAEMTGTAREGHERIKAIVRDLRQFTRLDEAERKVIRPSESLIATLNLVRTRFDRIEFVVDVDDDAPVECQPAKLGQVFMNLLINACDAVADCTDDRSGRVGLAVRVEHGEVMISIADNGCGMDAATRERIFEPFFTTKPVGAGTGLGLSISYGIIREHGGRIEVESTPDRGTCFTVRLPLRSVATATEHPA